MTDLLTEHTWQHN